MPIAIGMVRAPLEGYREEEMKADDYFFGFFNLCFMAYSVYILWSEKLGKYYIGSTEDIDRRLAEHNDTDNHNWTKTGAPWQLFFVVECNCLLQARGIEQHIKNMRSTKYVQHLKKYTEIVYKLKEKYPCTDC